MVDWRVSADEGNVGRLEEHSRGPLWAAQVAGWQAPHRKRQLQAEERRCVGQASQSSGACGKLMSTCSSHPGKLTPVGGACRVRAFLALLGDTPCAEMHSGEMSRERFSVDTVCTLCSDCATSACTKLRAALGPSRCTRAAGCADPRLGRLS